jgi:soluble lytic murein transglycosylase
MKYLLCFLLALPIFVWADADADFVAVRDAFRRGDQVQVEKYASHLDHTPLEPYVSYYRLRLGWDEPGKSAAIKMFLSRPVDTPVIEAFRSEWLKHLAYQQRWQEFAEEYPRHITEDSELACYALNYRQNLGEQGVLQEAKAKWFSPSGLPESCSPLFEAAISKGVISQADIWARIRLALEAGNLSLAKQLLVKLPAKFEKSLNGLDKAAANPAKYLSKIKFVKGSVGQRMVAMYAVLNVAKLSPENGHEQWQKISQYFPEEERQYFHGWLAYYSARLLDERALARYKEAGDSPLNENQLAWRVRAALRAGDWHEVSSTIARMSPQQQNEAAWRYWKARALKASGRSNSADMLFTELSHEYNFYGQLSADELGLVPDVNLTTTRFHIEKTDLANMEQHPAVQRTIALYRMEMRTEAAKEWSWMASRLNDTQLLAASAVAMKNEMFDRAIYAADRTGQIHDFNLRYPSPYRDSLREHVTEFGLDEAWVYGLMRQESRFVTRAKSNVGAAGLMQVMPATARWIAKKLHMVDYRKDLIHQLDVNLKLGTFYMKNVLDSLDESPVLASAAYNAGPGRARHWRANKPLEGAIYAETIPFDETRDYVKKVMSNTVYYSKLFGQPAQTLKQRLGTIAAKSSENMTLVQDER